MNSSRPLSIWCRYDKLGASSRLRFIQFIPELEKAGFKTDFHHFFDDQYLKRLYAGNGKSKTAFLAALRRRYKELAVLPENVPLFIEYELLPFLPCFAEKRFLAAHPYILNFDDAVDLRYSKLPVLKNKYPQLIADAAGIIVANDELLNRFSLYNKNIFKLPTVPPPPCSDPVAIPPSTMPLRIGWIGTPVTHRFLAAHTDILQKMYDIAPFELLVIANSALPEIPGIPTFNVDWSQASEHALLQSCHAGIMPLDDSAFARGKSAFKLIQYLRAGIPAIASAIGENQLVIKHGKTGFCASDAGEWVEAWQKLADDAFRASLKNDIALQAEKYSFERNAQLLTGFLTSTLEKYYG
ncbi:MAG: glycosyltransferase [Lentisphaeria bacterium]|nr:glycosyltransferase [Lentisphaeria bacterium]